MPEPYTHATSDPAELRDLLCKCSRCSEVSRCTRFNDFFTLGDEPDVGKPLVCQSCFDIYCADRLDGVNRERAGLS
jgi:hypothetical protein